MVSKYSLAYRCREPAAFVMHCGGQPDEAPPMFLLEGLITESARNVSFIFAFNDCLRKDGYYEATPPEDPARKNQEDYKVSCRLIRARREWLGMPFLPPL